MESGKKKKLEETYERILNVGFCTVPYEDLSEIIVPDPMVYGTAKDERILSFDGVEALFRSQYEQIGNMKPVYDRKRIALRLSNGGNNAFIIEELTFTLSSDEEIHTIFLRATCVMEYLDNQWKLTHWHSSTPVDTENDPWHMEEWKREKEKLQQLVDQQTADLQIKNRELEIEAALERVRSVALSLTKSEQMLDVAESLYNELYSLGFKKIRNALIDIQNEDKNTFMDYDYSPEMGKTITLMSYDDDPILEEQRDELKNKEDGFFEIILEGQKLQDLINLRIKNGEEEDLRLLETDQLTYNMYSFGNGEIGISNFGILADEQKEVLRKFKNVFALAYKRYNDLVGAEKQTREVQIELSLERIRAQVTAMQGSTDLFDIVVGMRKEFLALGNKADYFWHMRWLPDSYEMSMTSEDGSRIGMVITLPKLVHDKIPGLAEWEKGNKPTYVLALDADDAWDYIENMNTHGHYEQLDSNAPTRDDIRHIGGLTFIMARTTHGEIGFSLPGMVPKPPKEAMDTLVRFAGVFDLAYKRFEDLKAAEKDLIEIKAARLKAEEALTELKATQSQLFHSEKMASLGELTAGIAHEIQNPLNFVNNFSEVSTELVDEMNEELEKGNTQDAKQIAVDLKQNLEKINHHGRRAGDIVKGMLQHSRSSSSQKEPTDINALADEYLRLAYHGLRAKDKSFNATMKTDFDESIGQINVVPQDIGRVILNLITNAFYVVNEKAKGKTIGYEPQVTVSTKKLEGKIEIRVKDNGNGIPDHIKEKIFQPFFTTKPTGQGTGLGLSLSYDIVKAHGGELKVETKDGGGSEFVILL